LFVEAQYEFHFEKLKAQKAREVVEWALEQVLGRPVRARFALGGADRQAKAANRGGTQAQSGAPASGRPQSNARPSSTGSAVSPASASSMSSTDGAVMNGTRGTAQFGTAPNGHTPQSALNGQAGTLPPKNPATNETAARQSSAG